MIDKLKSRKFLLFVILLASSLLFLWFDKFNANQFIEFIKWLFGIYAVGNVGEHVSGRIKKGDSLAG